MDRVSIFLFSVLLSLFVGQAAAHQPLPRVDWCSGHGVTIEIVGQFHFSRAVLESYKTCLRNGTCVLPTRAVTNQDEVSGLALTDEKGEPGMPICRSAKDCGETNDDWMLGTRVATSFCSSYRTTRTSLTSDVGAVILYVTAPSTYNAANHHASYSITSGLAGQCLRCANER